MKALVYEKAHSLADFAIKLVEIPVPTPREKRLRSCITESRRSEQSAHQDFDFWNGQEGLQNASSPHASSGLDCPLPLQFVGNFMRWPPGS